MLTALAIAVIALVGKNPDVDAKFVPDPADKAFYYPLGKVVPVTSPFGWRVHPISGARRFHAGTDLAADMGDPVLAAHSGWVRFAGQKGGYGNCIELEYADGKYRTLYGHLSEILVHEGDAIPARSVIGRVGSTGASTGPHLHFELRQQQGNDWVAIDAGTQLKAVEPYYAAVPTFPKGQARKTVDPAAGVVGALDFTL